VANDQFESWQNALAQNQLAPEQLAVLQRMVDDGEAQTLQDAAARLDWQSHVITPAEHMWGF